MTGRTLACVLIQLEGWLDKTRVEIVALDCSGCGTPVTILLRFGLKFGSVNVICVDSMRESRERDFSAHSNRI